MASQRLFFLSIIIIIYWNGCHDIMTSFLGVIQMAPFWLELLLPLYLVKTKQNKTKKTTTFYTICRHPPKFIFHLSLPNTVYVIFLSLMHYFSISAAISLAFIKSMESIDHSLQILNQSKDTWNAYIVEFFRNILCTVTK